MTSKSFSEIIRRLNFQVKADVARWNNFHIWRGKLPHWRADDVTYFATFRHRRDLDAPERKVLFQALMRTQGRTLDVVALCVLPDRTEMLFEARPSPRGGNHELSKAIETAKRKAGKKIIENTGERFPPFFEESYDRIVRDEAELEERFEAILAAPVEGELCEDPDDFPTLFIADAPA